MRSGRVLDGRNAHQPGHLEAISRTALVEEAVERGRRNAALLRLVACIDLHETGKRPARPVELARQRCSKAGPVHRLNHVEQPHRRPDLVRLQPADQVQPDIGEPFPERRPAHFRLLYAVLAKEPVPRRQRTRDPRLRLQLRHSDQPDGGRVSPGGLRSRLDTVCHRRQPTGGVTLFETVHAGKATKANSRG